ncbi:MAG: hypothetical protein O7C59_05220, partial [Rickettsia endosymbiont of Ixodes persulcatus]|nr:hypothetical protein [Rickettsia endosymbiont of Ixodes persulcatus]
ATVGDGAPQPIVRDIAVVVAGDFNSTPQSAVYALMTGADKHATTSATHSSSIGSDAVDGGCSMTHVHTAACSHSPSVGPVSPNRRHRLLLDSTLLRPSKWLRALGIDTICHTSSSSSEVDADQTAAVDNFFALARKENRTIGQ